jgi:hypothetical protein
MKQLKTLLKRYHLLRDLVLGLAATAISCGVAAAWHTNTRPDDVRAIYSAFHANDLTSISVDQDQQKGVIRLTGIVTSADRRDLAQQIAQQAAPDYTIDDQIQVNRAGL